MNAPYKPELHAEDRIQASLAERHLASLPADRRAMLEREWEPPAPYRITPERLAELEREWPV